MSKIFQEKLTETQKAVHHRFSSFEVQFFGGSVFRRFSFSEVQFSGGSVLSSRRLKTEVDKRFSREKVQSEEGSV